MSNPSKFLKSVFNLSVFKYNYKNVFLINKSVNQFNRLQFRYLTQEVSQTNGKIHFRFVNGFFKFKIDENNYVVSYWTPLRALIHLMDTSTEVFDVNKVVDEQNKMAYSSSIPIGFVFCDLRQLAFKHPTLGLCQIEFDGNNEELIQWKEKFESELHYGTDTGLKKEKSLEDHELSFLEHQKLNMKVEFRPILKEYNQIVSLARTDAHRKFKWGGLFLLSAQMGFVARLTWFEYSWDIMEPITWMLTYAMMVGTFAYYIVTSQEYLVPSVERRLTIKKFWKLAQKQNFDVIKFRQMRQQLKLLDEKILRIKTTV